MGIPQRVIYCTQADLDAFNDRDRVDRHFGLPLSNTFSMSIRPEDGLCKVHQVKSQSRPRQQHRGNFIAMRWVKTEHPDAWVWHERYRLIRRIGPTYQLPQKAFRSLIDPLLFETVVRRGEAMGFTEEGLPDHAVYYPSQKRWEFFEVKMDGDDLSDEQKAWLNLINEVFGDGTGYELRIVLK